MSTITVPSLISIHPIHPIHPSYEVEMVIFKIWPLIKLFSRIMLATMTNHPSSTPHTTHHPCPHTSLLQLPPSWSYSQILTKLSISLKWSRIQLPISSLEPPPFTTPVLQQLHSSSSLTSIIKSRTFLQHVTIPFLSQVILLHLLDCPLYPSHYHGAQCF